VSLHETNQKECKGRETLKKPRQAGNGETDTVGAKGGVKDQTRILKKTPRRRGFRSNRTGNLKSEDLTTAALTYGEPQNGGV